MIQGDCLLNSVNIGFMASECLDASSTSDIPYFRSSVTSAGDKDVLIGRQGERHDVAGVIVERQ